MLSSGSILTGTIVSPGKKADSELWTYSHSGCCRYTSCYKCFWYWACISWRFYMVCVCVWTIYLGSQLLPGAHPGPNPNA